MRPEPTGRRPEAGRECQCMFFWVKLILWATRNAAVVEQPCLVAAARRETTILHPGMSLPASL